jgi:hypothetical protein
LPSVNPWQSTTVTLQQEKCLVLGDSFVIKYEGKLAGLATKSFATPYATFIKGNFYEPKDFLQFEVWQQIEANQGRYNPYRGEFALMRAVNPGNLRKLKRGKLAEVPNLIDTLPQDLSPEVWHNGNRMSRNDFAKIMKLAR